VHCIRELLTVFFVFVVVVVVIVQQQHKKKKVYINTLAANFVVLFYFITYMYVFTKAAVEHISMYIIN
jgi:hypothetical protein